MAGFLPLPPHTEEETSEHQGRTYVSITRAEQVTPEMVEWIVEEVDLLYPDRIDWEDVWDRLEGPAFEGGVYLEWGDNDTPAMRKIQREVRKARR